MQFFAVKTRDGYLKNCGCSELKMVPLAQASVFAPEQIAAAEALAGRAREIGCRDVTVMELTVLEKVWAGKSAGRMEPGDC